MKQSLFLEFARDQLGQVENIIKTKGLEYSGSDDALSTYRKAANYLGNVMPEDVVLSRIIEKMERLRHQSELNKELSKDALLDIIGHILFVLAFQQERKHEHKSSADI